MVKGDKKMETEFATPFEDVMSSMGDSQCSLCRYQLKDKTWHCSDVSSWYVGKNPCMKKEEINCPIARNERCSQRKCN
jgi:hypothetical protein